MQTILLHKSDEAYLQKCASDLHFAFGIIIGQQAEPEKYIVVHLAKNGDEDADLLDTTPTVTEGPNGIQDIDTQALTNQWLSAIKMIPGSFTVLGIFIAGTDAALIEEESIFKHAKSLLYDVQSLLVLNPHFSNIVDVGSGHLFLAYSTATNRAVCKSYTHNSNGGNFTQMDCRFVEKPFEWHTFECNYELEDVFPILVDDTHKVNIEQQFQRTIDAMKRRLASSEILFENENLDDSLALEAYVKRKNKDNKSQAYESSAFIHRATIFLPLKCENIKGKRIYVRQFNGTIRFSGVISSRIYCNPKNTFDKVKQYIRQDVLRSLAARIQVYCDGLTDTNISNDAILITEPPRRVYFNLSTAANGGKTNPIQFSDYIFRGEAPTVAVAQAKQVLDLDINSEHISADLEGLPDDESYVDFNTPSIDTDAKAKGDLVHTFYMLGIAVALLVLFASILVHYLYN